MFRKSLRSVPAPVFLFAVMSPFLVAMTIDGAQAATPSGTCVSAQIETPFRLPDGSLHAAGTLTLCDARTFSPVATLHKTYVNGRPTGMFLSRKRRGEADSSVTPAVVFQRDGAGHLDLLGYVLASAGRSVAYQMGERRRAPSAPALAGSPAPIAFVIAAVK